MLWLLWCNIFLSFLGSYFFINQYIQIHVSVPVNFKHLCIILFIHLNIIVYLHFLSTCNFFHLTSYLPLFLVYFSEWPVIWFWFLPHCSDWLLCGRFLRQSVISLVFKLEGSVLVLFLRSKMKITTPLQFNNY